MKPTYHVYGDTYSFSNDPVHMAQIKKSLKATEAFEDAMKDLVENMDVPYSYDDEDLLMHIARIVEATGGSMPFTVCSLCGSQDDGHNNNHGECA